MVYLLSRLPFGLYFRGPIGARRPPGPNIGRRPVAHPDTVVDPALRVRPPVVIGNLTEHARPARQLPAPRIGRREHRSPPGVRVPADHREHPGQRVRTLRHRLSLPLRTPLARGQRRLYHHGRRVHVEQAVGHDRDWPAARASARREQVRHVLGIGSSDVDATRPSRPSALLSAAHRAISLQRVNATKPSTRRTTCETRRPFAVARSPASSHLRAVTVAACRSITSTGLVDSVIGLPPRSGTAHQVQYWPLAFAPDAAGQRAAQSCGTIQGLGDAPTNELRQVHRNGVACLHGLLTLGPTDDVRLVEPLSAESFARL